jgi:hypothetical protein
MLNKRIIPISLPVTGQEEWEALKEPLMSGWLTSGPKVREFEQLFAERHRVKHALAVTSATTALHLALVALGVKEGDEVIVPAFTWVSTANVVLYCGAKVVFVDINPLTYNIDPDTLPQNTLDPVDSIIDPTQKYPGEGLPSSISGQRYLIVADIPHQITYNSLPNAWPGLTTGAIAGSIIEYDETEWFISFDTTQIQVMQFVTNLTSGVQYRYIADQGWMKSYEGYYNQGDWRIII